MDEDKNKKPLLSYEQVIEIIDERVSRDEAAAELEAECRKKALCNGKKKKRRYFLKWFCGKLFKCTKK